MARPHAVNNSSILAQPSQENERADVKYKYKM